MEKTILTITGSDSTGDSGIQADIRTIMELGGTATSVITSITVQNTLGIVKIFEKEGEVERGKRKRTLTRSSKEKTAARQKAAVFISFLLIC